MRSRRPTPRRSRSSSIFRRDGHHRPDLGTDPDLRPAADRRVRARQLTIDGNANNRIFSIFATDPGLPGAGRTGLSGVDLRSSAHECASQRSDNTGGAIFTEHSLALDSVIIDNSIARTRWRRRFSVQYPGQSLTITNSQFLNNIATELLPAIREHRDGRRCWRLAGSMHGASNASRIFHSITPVSVTIANSEFRGNRVATGDTRWSRRGDSLVLARRHHDLRHGDRRQSCRCAQSAGRGQGLSRRRHLRRPPSRCGSSARRSPRTPPLTSPARDVTRSGGLHCTTTRSIGRVPATRWRSGSSIRRFRATSSSATAGAMVAFGNVALELDNSTVSDNSAAPTRTGGIVMSTGRHLSRSPPAIRRRRR